MQMLIAGEWMDKNEKIDVVDPFDQSKIDTVPRGSSEDVQRAVESAVQGAKTAKNMPVHKRTDILKKTASYVEKHKEEFAETIAREGSKTIKEARGETFRCINTLTVAAEEVKRIAGETLPFDSIAGSENRTGYYYRFPIGIIAAITPFNDPLNLVAHKLGPAIAGGNAVVLKPATVTPLSALKLGQAFREAGLPPHVLNIITGYGREIGGDIVTDQRIRMISFTGGLEAGIEISKKAGLKKLGMELGSNTPVIIMDDCDLEKAVELSVSGSFWAAGQNCIGVQRLLIQEKIYPGFVRQFVDRTKQYKTGDKLKEDTDMGPMITENEAKRIESWVEEAIAGGAKVLSGHKRKGSIYPPTVLENAPDGSKVDVDEVFAPVVSLYKFKTLDEAIDKANSVNFGLHAGIFTRDIHTAFKAVHGLDVGGVIINDSSDYRLDLMPFGGVKGSGLGREGIKFALQEMTEPKVVCFNL
ncbi:MAG: aldehyde dehydrogenase family protein [Acidobacteriota bacterium]